MIRRDGLHRPDEKFRNRLSQYFPGSFLRDFLKSAFRGEAIARLKLSTRLKQAHDHFDPHLFLAAASVSIRVHGLIPTIAVFT